MTRSVEVGLVTAVIALAGCGGDAAKKPQATAPTPGKSCASPAGGVPAGEIDPQVLWPPAPYCTSDPAVIARSFATRYMGLEGEPSIGPFRESRRDPPAGEIDINRVGEDGRPLDAVLTTLTLRVLDDAHYWYVTAAKSPEVEISDPEALAAIGSPVTVQGRGRGFEGNVVIEVRAAYRTSPLAQRPVIAGSMAALEPFTAELRFTPPAGADTGAIVAQSGSGIAAVNGFAAVPVRFSR